MLMAQLHGKLPSDLWVGSEDLLTSAVFGTLKYLPPAMVAALLARATPLEGSESLALSGPLEWHFWPWWEICEPDVVIEDAKTLCVVEAKLYAEFGESEGAGNQLDREWRDGSRVAGLSHKDLWLLAVTNHGTLPAAAMRRQLVASTADRRRVSWLSWLTIGQFLREQRVDANAAMIDDLLELLARMGLAPFSGFGEVIGECTDLVMEGVSWLTDVCFRQGDDLVQIGFGSAVAEALGWHSGGGMSWQPTLR